MERVLVLGGYGAVGREAVAGLRGHVPEIVVAGRDIAKARTVDGAIPMRIDLRHDDLDEALTGVDAVVMCAERENVRVAEACLRRGVHYVDVSASREILSGIERLNGLAVAVASGGSVRAFSGRRQSRATGLAAALVVRRLDGTAPGVHHIEDAVGPGFLTEPADEGFELSRYSEAPHGAARASAARPSAGSHDAARHGASHYDAR